MVPSPSTAKTGALRLDQPRRERKRQRAADRAGDAVDQAAAHRQHALAPLRELAAVADQHRVGIALDDTGAARGTPRPDAGGPASARRCCATPPAGCRARRGPRRASRSSRGVSLAARAISVSAARLASATQPSSRRSPFSVLARSTSAASGSIAISRTFGSNAGPDAHFGGEVERLAEQHDQVGAPHQIGERAERGVGDAARALHDDGGRAGRGLELREQARGR